MIFFNWHIVNIFNVAFLTIAACALCACFKIPSENDENDKIEYVSVIVNQQGKVFSEPLKINANYSASLVAKVYPDVHKNNVKYFWYVNDYVIDSGNVYNISQDMMLSDFTRDSFIPDKIVVIDNEKNELQISFKAIVNFPPVISKNAIPNNGDTLYGNQNTPFEFSWESSDKNDVVENFLIIDSVTYSVGNLNSVKQSGFSPGVHTFNVIAKDSFGDIDSLKTRTFYIVSSLRGK